MFFCLISTVFCSDAHFSRTRHVTCKAAPLASTYHETFPRMKERHGSPKCGTNTWPIRVFLSCCSGVARVAASFRRRHLALPSTRAVCWNLEVRHRGDVGQLFVCMRATPIRLHFIFRTGAAQENVGMPPQGALGTVAQLSGVP